MRFFAHVRALWGGRGWLLPLIPSAYMAAVAAFDHLRPEHLVFALLSAALGWIGPRTKRFLLDVTPYVAVGIGYDLFRYVRPWLVTPDRIVGCELRNVELALFPAAPNTTFPDWFAVHHSAAFDLLFALPYTVFIYLVLGYAAYLYFKDRPRMRHYLLAFGIANYISFACWLILPAAPPWYLNAHGCAIDAAALPSAAGLARVDELLGIGYYATFYGRASAVFGAMPSMHCAYPLIGLLTAWRAASWRTRPLHIAYAAIMAIAAVYLNHHWVLDVVAGWAVAGISVAAAGAWLRRRAPVERSARRAAAANDVAVSAPERVAQPSYAAAQSGSSISLQNSALPTQAGPSGSLQF